MGVHVTRGIEPWRVFAQYMGRVDGPMSGRDGNVHMGVFQKDPEIRSELMRSLFRAGMDLGGAISGEHGLGTEKRKYFVELEDPVKLDLMRRIKQAFDPHTILNPGKVI